ncbi:MAG TPA: beta-galactosidase [Candidatus Fusicatenibacter intestinigallinarum]|uniref:Beta-galactosidase n=1 Tax=Candidatus Fusicatenibacter intestinigallinarum TaxID=2838598 RepID=A0A9D2NBJ4_9FIRM|nr:beta-galactosidase [Candidatus Fusicatenibacter intestinigallinarum]
MKKPFKRILYGGDYNPNQWPKEIWQEDMRMFRDAHINSATINVFSWAKLQPSEETYDFEELDEIVKMLEKEGYDIVMATSTAALPAWMVKRYPEVARTDYEGRHHKFGQRHNACPNSPVYQKYAAALTEQLAKRYGKTGKVACWHVNNEYGGECYCENCEKAFRVWLRKKYGTIEEVNKAWNMEFWGHTLYDWDEIVLPNALGEGIGPDKTAFAGISIDYRRFNSDSILENFKMERDIIRRYDPETPVTTNLMGTYPGLDYFKWAKEMDVVSWDNYPSYDTPWSQTAMCHDLMRGLKNEPFMLMEQTPSQQNWQPYNSLKKPGQMRAQSYQTMAHGADTIQFFQLRRSVGACEKFHGAVIAHAGTENTRVFREVAALGEELERLGETVIGSMPDAKIGVIFDWDNYWALEYTSGPNRDLKYVDQIHQYYSSLYRKNYSVDMIPVDADFSRYRVIIAPVLYMVKEGMAEALERFVAQGGILLTTFMSGIVGQSDNVHLGGYPGPLRKMAGVWVEEIDALAPEQTNSIRFSDGTVGTCRLLCDLMHLEGAEALAEYTSNFYAGMPAVTRNAFGKGAVYYVGANLDQASLDKVMSALLAESGTAPTVKEPTDLEVTVRETETEKITFLINFQPDTLPLPAGFAGKTDLLSGKLLETETALAPYDVILVAEPKEKQ